MKKIIPILLSIFFQPTTSHEQCPAENKQVKRLQIDSFQVAYTEQGKGKCIILIHGLGGNASHWNRNTESLSRQYRCISIDLPGYGYSDYVSIYNTENQLDFYARIITSFVKQLTLNKPALMGHSMGGQIAIITALRSPELFSKLVLIAPAGLEIFTTSEASLLTTYATPAFFQHQDSVTVWNNIRRNFYQFPAEAESLVAERIALQKCSAFGNYCQAVAAGIKGMLGHTVKEKLKDITLPTLVIFGNNDALIPNKVLHPALTTIAVSEISRAIKNVKVRIVPDAGHMVQFEQPVLVNKEVINFLK